MKPKQLILRCYGEEENGVWQAFCIDLNLAVQGNSAAQVRTKLNEQIYSYLYDALEGEDQKYAAQLLNRKSPLGFRLKYYYYKTVHCCLAAHQGICDHIFNIVMPLAPVHHRT